MRRPMGTWMTVIVVTALMLFACSTVQKRYTLPDSHPEEVGKGRPNCLDCHEANDGQIVYSDFVHTVDYAKSHRFQAYQNSAVCGMCHAQSFCNECHNTKVELKPSILRQSDTYRRLPHRGDYLARHRIDGRLDPVTCFRCHGNPKSSKTCKPCHG